MLMAKTKIKEIKDTLQRISNRKAPGPTGERSMLSIRGITDGEGKGYQPPNTS